MEELIHQQQVPPGSLKPTSTSSLGSAGALPRAGSIPVLRGAFPQSFTFPR